MKRQLSVSERYYQQQEGLMRPLLQATGGQSWLKRWTVAEASHKLERRLRHTYPRGKAYERLIHLVNRSSPLVVKEERHERRRINPRLQSRDRGT